MKCTRCNEVLQYPQDFHAEWDETDYGTPWISHYWKCPNCHQYIDDYKAGFEYPGLDTSYESDMDELSLWCDMPYHEQKVLK